MFRTASLLTIAWLSLLPGPARASEEALFDATLGAPVEQGWRRAAEESSTLEGLLEGDPAAWRIGGSTSSVNRILYTHPLPEGSLAQEAWSAEATLRVVEASAEAPRDVVLEVLDGVSQWALCFVRVRGEATIGHLTPEGSYKALGEAALADAFGTLQARYDPATSSLEVTFNGERIGTLTRDDVPPTAHAHQRRIAWGDNNAAAPADHARSEAYWQKVRFLLNPQ